MRPRSRSAVSLLAPVSSLLVQVLELIGNLVVARRDIANHVAAMFIPHFAGENPQLGCPLPVLHDVFFGGVHDSRRAYTIVSCL